jgi:hypothetical protein
VAVITVRDYDSETGKWLVWEASTLQKAYVETPYTNAVFAGQLHITRDRFEAGGVVASADLVPRSVWRQDGDDVFAGFHLNGHTGRWAIDIHEPAAGGRTLRGLVEENGDYVPEGSGDAFGAIFTLDLIDIYPVRDGLADTLWLAQDGDVVLNTPN